jgi:hypothetical protein
MTDPFAAFESATPAAETPEIKTEITENPAATIEADPAADFLASQEAEMNKIENDATENQEEAAAPAPEIKNQEQPFAAATNDFTSDFDALSVGNGGATNNQETKLEVADEEEESSDPFAAVSKIAQEGEKIKAWREEQRERLETKDNEEAVKKNEWKESAKKELEEWYQKRADQQVKTHENNKVTNKAAEAELVAPRDSQNGNEWEKLAKNCDFNPKGNKNNRDVSRMRSILLQLKQTPLIR